MALGYKMNLRKTGFTIVELLIVIVVIAILAAITIVAYTGIQNRAYDSAVQKDLQAIGSRAAVMYETNGAMPSVAELVASDIKVTGSAYGNNYITSGNAEYNMLRCWTTSLGSRFIFVAASKSGTVYKYDGGSVTEGVGPLQTHTTTCANNGLSTSGTWFYDNGNWLMGLGG